MLAIHLHNLCRYTLPFDELELPTYTFSPFEKQVDVTLTFGHGKVNPIFERRTEFGEEANRGPGRRCISGWTSSPSGLLHPCGLRSNGTKGFVSHLPASNNEDTLLVTSLWLISTSKEALFHVEGSNSRGRGR